VLVTSVYRDRGGTCFSTQNRHAQRSPVGAIHELPVPRVMTLTCPSVLGLGRGLTASFVGAIQRFTAGTTSVPLRKNPRPLRKSLGGTCLSGPHLGKVERDKLPRLFGGLVEKPGKTRLPQETPSTFPRILRGIRLPAPLQVPACPPYGNNTKGSGDDP